MAKIHFGLLEGVKNNQGKSKLKNGNIPIYLTIYHNFKIARFRTKIEIPSAVYWNTDEETVYKKPKTPDAAKMNDELKKMRRQAEDAVSIVEKSDAEVTAKAIMNVFRRLHTNTFITASDNRNFSFLKFADEYLERIYNNGQYAQWRRHNVFVHRIKCYVNGVKPNKIELYKNRKAPEGKDLLFSDITYRFLVDFDTYLHKLPNLSKKGLRLNQNTIKKEMEIFRALFTQGVNIYEEKGLKIERNPFNKFEFKGVEPHEKAKLSFEEIEALESLKLQEGSTIWNARNCFLFAFYCGGTRFGDNIQIRGCNISKEEGSYRLKYTMDKTGKRKNIVLVDKAIEILKKYIDLDSNSTNYVFPYLDNKAPYAKAITPEEKEALPPDETKRLKMEISAKNALVNKYLKILAEKAGINKHISTHIARHSFADLARKNTGDIYDIKTILGHSSINTTQTYLNKLDTETQDKALQNVFHKEDKTSELLKQLQQLDKETLKQILTKLAD